MVWVHGVMGMDRFGFVLVRPFSDPNIGGKTSNLLDTEYKDCENPEPPVEVSKAHEKFTIHIHTKVPWTSNKASERST